MWKVSRNARYRSSGSFSAPVTTRSSERSSSGRAFLSSGRTEVGADLAPGAYLVTEQDRIGYISTGDYDGDDPNALIGLPLIRLVELLQAEGLDVLTSDEPPA